MSAPATLEALAEREGLTLVESFEVHPYTPSLWRATGPAATGRLADGIEGTIAVPSVPVEGGGSVARPVVVAHLPGTIARIPELLCRDAAWRVTREYELTTTGFKRLDHETIFESASVERRFAVEHPEGVDAIFLRRLFTPTFLDWLGDHAPPELFFELVNGRLGVILAEGNDVRTLWESAGRIAARLRDESAEGRRPGGAPFAEPLPAPATQDEATAKGIAGVRWQRPPETVEEAADAYVAEVPMTAAVFARALFLAAAISGILLVLAVIDLLVFGDPFSSIGLILAAFGLFVVLFRTALRNPRARLAAEWAKLAFAEQFAAAEGLELEDPGAVHERWPDLPLPGPVRRLWRGSSPSGRVYRLMLIHDPSHTPGRSGFEGLLVEDAGPARAKPAGEPVEEIHAHGLLALVRPTPAPSPTAAGLRELRDAAEAG